MIRTVLVVRAIAMMLLTGCVTDQTQLEKQTDDVARVEKLENADKLFIVDCALPGQIRRLGTMTLLTARRPVKVTAGECEIRGGEYVAYDRANLATSLNIWLPKAREGDAEAQVYVGEMYEKGLGVISDYKTAAEWYRKAAAQGNSRAQTNLGYLYERGLGVDKNLSVAMDWYRKSSGLEAKNLPYAPALNTVANNELVEENRLLKGELKKSQDESNALSNQLSENQRLLKESQEKLKRFQDERDKTQLKLSNALSQGHATEIARLEKLLREKEDAMTGQEQQVSLLAKRYQQKVDTLNQKLEESDQRVKRIESKLKTQAVESIAEKPVIEIIDPPVALVRSGTPTVTLRSSVAEREVIGKINSSSGIISLMVNDIKNTLDDKGMFKASVKIKGEKTPVSIVAVDQNGKRESLDFLFALSEQGKNSPATLGQDLTLKSNFWKTIDFGNYYALIIGNQHYKKLESLDTPINDAREVDRILRDKYGFKTILLLDANRYQMLSALNRLGSDLTKNDNLLIYYAGHGELDRINDRGHWLPEDAEADNDANWIPNYSITDHLNSMSSMHILMVVDSCYAGTLTRSSLTSLDAGLSDEKQAEMLQAMLKLKSRTVLTAGGVEPVIDGGGGGKHSIFANAFIKALNSNDTLLEGQQLFKQVAEMISLAQVDQKPIYAPIQHTGHEAGGEFFFLPK